MAFGWQLAWQCVSQKGVFINQKHLGQTLAKYLKKFKKEKYFKSKKYFELKKEL